MHEGRQDQRNTTAALPGHANHWRTTVIVGLAAAALFATTVTDFEARVTDLAARRVLEGELPYRDFWSMYAPGSYTVLAAAFWAFGRELIVSNILGLIVAAASVAAYYRLATRVAPAALAAVGTLLLAVAFWSSNYHSGFTSYPPVSLLIWLAVICLARYARARRSRDLVLVGVCLGIAVLFKHDVAGYACLATAAALIVTPGESLPSRLRAVGTIAGIVILVAASGIAVLWWAGAGPDLVRNLVVFPLTDFRYVRPEYFPLLPRVRDSAFAMFRELLYWGRINLPLYAAAIGLIFLWKERLRLEAERVAIVAFSATAYALFWSAAHVQLNTHIVSLTGLGALLGLAGLCAKPLLSGRLRRTTVFVLATAAIWSGIQVAEQGAKFAISLSKGRVWLGLPHLRGIAVLPSDALWMGQLASAMEAAADRETPLLMVSSRNDVVVFAEGVPYWLSARRIATRHHELHPGVTDTRSVQGEMLNDLSNGPPPVVVREHRFDTATLDVVKADFLRHVAVGSPLLDDWVARNYGRPQQFGSYELLHRLEP